MTAYKLLRVLSDGNLYPCSSTRDSPRLSAYGCRLNVTRRKGLQSVKDGIVVFNLSRHI